MHGGGHERGMFRTRPFTDRRYGEFHASQKKMATEMECLRGLVTVCERHQDIEEVYLNGD